ncbi:MAG: vanadium-dependent haloperoxidase, partial [Pseudomonadota bacterium]
GPYLSQFMLIGTKGDPKHGLIGYGAQVVDQRVLQAKKDDDYMMKWDDWMFVQRGFAPQLPGGIGQDLVDGTDGKPASRFICTPRDLATYVHVDQLYQAYLNAALILLGQGAPFDPGFDLLSGMGGGMLKSPGATEYVDYNAGGFALWGGPHILSLVTEVATRGLKAVRFQKFNVHLRLRPEALGARMERVTEIGKSSPSLCGAFDQMHSDLADVLAAVETHNEGLTGSKSKLLPMAFAEGSPMHPTYGAGHATVAGACVTMLKAFFDTSAVFVKVIDPDDNVSAHFWNKAQIFNALDKEDKRVIAGAYQPHCDGTPGHSELKFHSYGEYKLTGSGAKKKVVYHPDDMYSDDHVPCPLTLEGELNKLAANISIGRNMAGVHYYSDYYDSARMGEEIALGILEEQALCYPTDKFVVSVPTFDGDAVRIGRR